MAETILHDEMPVDGAFAIAAQELEHRYCVRFNGHESLRLANLTGAPLKALIGSSSISTELAYDTPKRWSSAIHAHPQMVDGLMYMSRHVNSERAVVIFDRARSKLGTARYTPLGNTTGALKAVLNLRIATRFL